MILLNHILQRSFNILPELSILSLFLNYNNWNTYSGKLTSKDFPDELVDLYRTLDVFHKEHNTEKADIGLLDLSALFFSTQRKDTEYFNGVFKTLEGYKPNEHAVSELIISLRKQRIYRELSLASYAAAEGKGKESEVAKLLTELQELATLADTDEEFKFVTDDLEELKHATISAPGLRWRLGWLNRALGSLRKGNFGFVFARPETGKTSFLASEISFMAEQLKEEDGPILWLNNEQEGPVVKLRMYQASLGLSTSQVFSNLSANAAEYKKRTHHKIKLYDDASITKHQVERLCKFLKPSLIIFDQIDKIQGFANDREDLRLGSIYIWARELAKLWCPVIGICQANGTGENVRYLTMAHVANSATAKQAEADFILGIGKITDTGWDAIRFLHLSKNKLLGDEDSEPELRHGHGEIGFDQEIARFRDL